MSKPKFHNYIVEEKLVEEKYIIGKTKKTITSDYDNFKPKFSYEYLALDSCSYNFTQDCINVNDYHKYFEMVKNISNLTIAELMGSSYRLHFHVDENPRPKSQIMKMLNQLYGLSLFDNSLFPKIGHFAIYTDKKDSDKPHRIHFIQFNQIFYILFFDPLHEIHKTKF